MDPAEVTVRVEAESDTSDPVGTKSKKILGTNYLVEDLMLPANIGAARQIYEFFPQSQC